MSGDQSLLSGDDPMAQLRIIMSNAVPAAGITSVKGLVESLGESGVRKLLSSPAAQSSLANHPGSLSFLSGHAPRSLGRGLASLTVGTAQALFTLRMGAQLARHAQEARARKAQDAATETALRTQVLKSAMACATALLVRDGA